MAQYATYSRSVAVYPPAVDEQPLDAGILDLATRKTCGTEYRYPVRWALAPPFHPYPKACAIEAVVFCHVASTVADSSQLGSAVLCVARTFLRRADAPATSRRAAKLSANLQIFRRFEGIIKNYLSRLLILLSTAGVYLRI